MKKLLFIIILAIFSISAFSQKSFIAKNFCSRQPGYSWSDWKDINIIIVFFPDNKRIIINTTENQIIDYVDLSTTNYADFTVYSGLATDSKYQTIKICVTEWKDGDVMLEINYSDFEYKYFCKPIIDDSGYQS